MHTLLRVQAALADTTIVNLFGGIITHHVLYCLTGLEIPEGFPLQPLVPMLPALPWPNCKPSNRSLVALILDIKVVPDKSEEIKKHVTYMQARACD